MIHVRLELWPCGDRSRGRAIGEAEGGLFDEAAPNYKVRAATRDGGAQ